MKEETVDLDQYRRRMLETVKRRVRRKYLAFNLTLEDIVIPDLCPIMKEPFDFSAEKGQCLRMTPTVDKLIPKLGYVKGNICVIANIANQLKGNATKEELINFGNNIEEYLSLNIK